MSTMNDVRDYLMKQLAELADSDASPEQQAQVVERAKATCLVANSIVATVKTEIDAIRLYDDTGKLPCAVPMPQTSNVRQIGRAA